MDIEGTPELKRERERRRKALQKLRQINGAATNARLIAACLVISIENFLLKGKMEEGGEDADSG